MQGEKIRTAVLFAILLAAALILSYLESLFGAFIPVPGVKIGLSNIVTVFILYKYGFFSSLGFAVCKSLLAAFFTGRLSSLIFSLCGAVLCVAAMALIKKTGRFSLFGVNLSGAIFHIVGQLCAASVVLQTSGVWLFLPWLAAVSAACGVVTYLILKPVLRLTENKTFGRNR